MAADPRSAASDQPFATIIAPFDECANCGSKARENVTWNRTGGWTCAACGESDYPEAAGMSARDVNAYWKARDGDA